LWYSTTFKDSNSPSLILNVTFPERLSSM